MARRVVYVRDQQRATELAIGNLDLSTSREELMVVHAGSASTVASVIALGADGTPSIVRAVTRVIGTGTRGVALGQMVGPTASRGPNASSSTPCSARPRSSGHARRVRHPADDDRLDHRDNGTTTAPNGVRDIDVINLDPGAPEEAVYLRGPTLSWLAFSQSGPASGDLVTLSGNPQLVGSGGVDGASSEGVATGGTGAR